MVRIINQPTVLRMGDIINDSLADSSSFDNFYFIVAFAKKSGVSRIQEAMQSFRSNGGIIKGVVGINNKITTIQGLRLLSRLTDELFIYHDEDDSHSFHPKIYVFEKTGVIAKVCIGSSNLTSGGLFTNYETDIELNLDLGNPNDLRLYRGIKEIFNSYTNTSDDCCKLLDEDLINQLIECNKLSDEDIRSATAIEEQEETQLENTGGETQRSLGSFRHLFGTKVIRPAPPPYREPVVNTPEEASPELETETPEVIKNILIREVPFAQDRTSQVHFTRGIVEDYFNLALGGSRHLRFRQFLSGRLKPIEERPLVYSERNRNPKIELAGARLLSRAYPTDGSRPILVFEEIEEGLFHYMLLLPEDNGFSELTRYLATVPQHGRALKYAIIDLGTMRSIWSRYPSMGATNP